MSDLVSLAGQLATPEDYARQSLAPETLRAYRGAWRCFEQWCQGQNLSPLPALPETVARYLVGHAEKLSRATLTKRVSAIGQYHELANLPFEPSHPIIRHTLRGINRRHGKPAVRSAALMTAEVCRLVATCGGRLTDVRDKALILVGYAGALRRSELVAIELEHVSFTEEGIRLLIPRSKTDAAGEGAEIGIPYGTHPETCPVRALDAWLRAARIQTGPVFRKVSMWQTPEYRKLSGDAVRQILLRRAKQAGLEVSSRERLSPHGLRAGFVTEAYRAGVSDEAIMGHTRHRDVRSMRGYVRRAGLVTESPAKKLGL